MTRFEKFGLELDAIIERIDNEIGNLDHLQNKISTEIECLQETYDVACEHIERFTFAIDFNNHTFKEVKKEGAREINT